MTKLFNLNTTHGLHPAILPPRISDTIEVLGWRCESVQVIWGVLCPPVVDDVDGGCWTDANACAFATNSISSLNIHFKQENSTSRFSVWIQLHPKMENRGI